MRFLAHFAWLATLIFGAGALAQAVPPPQRPFAPMLEQWTRQLDRIADRLTEPALLVSELDVLRDLATDVLNAAVSQAAQSREELADTRKLLAPLETKTGSEPATESQAVKTERARLQEQASIAEGRVKQSEVVVARADQLLQRMGRLRGELLLQSLLRKVPSPLSRAAWLGIRGDLASAWSNLATALSTWNRNGILAIGSGDRSATPLVFWALLTIAVWWLGRMLRKRYGRGDAAEPGQRDRALAAAIDGIGLGFVPIMAMWLIAQLLRSSSPPQLMDEIILDIAWHLTALILVFGLTSTMLAPERPAWRILPFSDGSARRLTVSVRRLVLGFAVINFVFNLLAQAPARHPAVESLGSLVMATTVGLLALPVLSPGVWRASRPEGSDAPELIGGTWWATLRVLLSGAVLLPILFAMVGYATMAVHIHAALAGTFLMVAVALLAHRMADDLLEAAAAPDTKTGAWVRKRFGLQPDQKLYGQHVMLLLVDAALVVLLAVAIPTSWGADTDNILRLFGRLLTGIKIGGVVISLSDIGLAILAFTIALGLAHLVRRIVSKRVMPTMEAPLALRQSVDAGLNYVGVAIALVVGITSLGVDFTNLAIVLGALSVGIGLGLQNIANNVISGIILLIERPIKAGDWVVVDKHEGFVKRINIRATEIETFQRTSVIVPNSMFLQSAVINRTYSDNSSRVEIKLTVGYDSDVPRIEAILREAALSHPRVLRVPPSVVRFVRLGSQGLEFELFAFVAQLEDRLVVSNDLNRVILEKIIEAGIDIPARATDVRVHAADSLVQALSGRTMGSPESPPPESRKSGN